MNYTWNFGDGVTAAGPGSTVTYVYNTPGTFSAQVQATTSTGKTTTASTTVVVKNVAGAWTLTLAPSASYPFLYCTVFTANLTQSAEQIRGTVTPTTCSAGHTNLQNTYSAPILAGNASDPRSVFFGNESPQYDDQDDIYWRISLGSDLNSGTGSCTTNRCSSATLVRK